MNSKVFFKFKACLEQQEIPFEGSCISVKDLKLAIRQKCSIQSYDLIITKKDTQNQEEEYSDNEMIPTLTNVVVRRIPPKKNTRNQKTNNPENFMKVDPYKTMNNKGVGHIFKNLNLATLDIPEDEKIDSIIKSCNVNYNINVKRLPQGVPPNTYTCNKCGIPGHWIHNCPGIPDKNGKLIDSRCVKRPSGIPVNRLIEVDENTPNSYLTADGRYVVNMKNHEAFLKGKKEKRPFSEEENPPLVANAKSDIPDNLVCGLCLKLLVKPTRTPCCKAVYCLECIAQRLFDPDKSPIMHICPNCGQEVDQYDSLEDDVDCAVLVNEYMMKKAVPKEVNENDKSDTINIKEEKQCKETEDDLLDEVFQLNEKENNLQNKIDNKENLNNVHINANQIINGQQIDNSTMDLLKQLILYGIGAQANNKLNEINPNIFEKLNGFALGMQSEKRKDTRLMNRSRSRSSKRHADRYDKNMRSSYLDRRYNNYDELSHKINHDRRSYRISDDVGHRRSEEDRRSDRYRKRDGSYTNDRGYLEKHEKEKDYKYSRRHESRSSHTRSKYSDEKNSYSRKRRKRSTETHDHKRSRNELENKVFSDKGQSNLHKENFLKPETVKDNENRCKRSRSRGNSSPEKRIRNKSPIVHPRISKNYSDEKNSDFDRRRKRSTERHVHRKIRHELENEIIFDKKNSENCARLKHSKNIAIEDKKECSNDTLDKEYLKSETVNVNERRCSRSRSRDGSNLVKISRSRSPIVRHKSSGKFDLEVKVKKHKNKSHKKKKSHKKSKHSEKKKHKKSKYLPDE